MTASFTAGTVSVTTGSDIVTGVGTGWLTANISPGFFGLDADSGSPVPVLQILSDTSLRLVSPWRGAGLSGWGYWLSYDTRDGQQTVNNAQRLAEYIARLGSAAMAAFLPLVPAANTIPYFTSASAAALATISAHGRALLGVVGRNGGYLRSTGTGTVVSADIVGQVLQVSGKPTAAIMERGSSVNGEYIRFADGTQICWLIVDKTSEDWNQQYGGLYVPVNQHSWTYPASFSAQPALIGTASRFGVGIAAGMMVKDVGPVFANIIPWICLATNAGTGKSIHVMAVGRWF